jgi:curli production assembly/transport component CsgE
MKAENDSMERDVAAATAGAGIGLGARSSLCIAMLISSFSTSAAPGGGVESGTLPEPSLEPRQTQDLILGVVTDQTITGIGRDFYQGFLATWRDYGAEVEQFNLAIYERPSARWGSLVWIEKDRVRLFQMFIQPGRGNYTKLGEQAAQQVYRRVGQVEIEKLLFKDPDLGDEEL